MGRTNYNGIVSQFDATFLVTFLNFIAPQARCF